MKEEEVEEEEEDYEDRVSPGWLFAYNQLRFKSQSSAHTHTGLLVLNEIVVDLYPQNDVILLIILMMYC